MLRLLERLLGISTPEREPAQPEAPATYIGKWTEIEELDSFAPAHDLMKRLFLPAGSEYFLLHDKRTIKLYTSATVDEVRDFVAEQLGLEDAKAHTTGEPYHPYCWVSLEAPYRNEDDSYNKLWGWCIEVARPRIRIQY